MTVGIAAVTGVDSDPGVVVAADRMVTVGEGGGVEYEDSEGKVDTFVNNQHVSAVAVGAGVSTYIDEVLNLTNTYVRNADEPPETIQHAMQYCLAAYQETVRQTISNQVFQPLGYALDDLQDESVRIPSEIQRAMVEQVNSIRQETANRVNIIVAGVGADGAGVYHLAGMDETDFTEIGYVVIGSGSDSARLTFTRQNYDRTCTLPEGVFSVLEAKSQAEERQGVGQRMDFVTIKGSEIHRFDAEEKQKLRGHLTVIGDKEEEARQRVIEEWDSNGG